MLFYTLTLIPIEKAPYPGGFFIGREDVLDSDRGCGAGRLYTLFRD